MPSKVNLSKNRMIDAAGEVLGHIFEQRTYEEFLAAKPTPTPKKSARKASVRKLKTATYPTKFHDLAMQGLYEYFQSNGATEAKG